MRATWARLCPVVFIAMLVAAACGGDDAGGPRRNFRPFTREPTDIQMGIGRPRKFDRSKRSAAGHPRV